MGKDRNCQIVNSKCLPMKANKFKTDSQPCTKPRNDARVEQNGRIEGKSIKACRQGGTVKR